MFDMREGGGDLVYVSDGDPGLRRVRRGRGFSYPGASAQDLARARALGIPPAWREVWICADPRGHIQATGIDARGRKQYRYHKDWSAARADTKYGQLAAFGAALPAIRARMAADLRAAPGDRDFTIAALVMLIDRTFLRIGNAAYAAANRSFGATTLLSRHLTVADGVVSLRFRAKGGKPVRQTLRDRRLSRILHDIGDLPGRNLFTWLDDDGAVRKVGSQDVNAWLAEAAGLPVTAKTFRTWGGTLAAWECALATPPDARLTLRALAEAAAARLQNTPAIARKSYVHPAVLDLAAADPAARAAALDAPPAALSGLRGAEPRLLGFLRRHGD